MANINEHYLQLPGGYLFSEINRHVEACVQADPKARIIRLGIGDVTRPLPEAVTVAMHEAVDEMGTVEGFRGYGPEQGYTFLRERIAHWDYEERGVHISADEIFISDGAKSDCGNIGDIFGQDNVVAVCDPVYPVYVDTNAMAGRAGIYDKRAQRWTKIHYMPCTMDNGFVPAVPADKKLDLIYLCFPNNPTGSVASREQLQGWVEYANAVGAVIFFDSAYEAFITESDVPHSIFEIEGAKTCAIEFRSFSKTAGFTGTRCGYTVIPHDLIRGGISLNALWNRRQTTKFNGVSYVVQRGAAAIYSAEGQRQVRQTLSYYRDNARTIRKGLMDGGLTVFGGVNAPYIWVKTPEGLDSWAFFDRLLNVAKVVTTPGAGFGPSGEGYIRVTAFGDADGTREAVERIRDAV